MGSGERLGGDDEGILSTHVDLSPPRILSAFLQVQHSYPHLTDEDMETQRGGGTAHGHTATMSACSRSLSRLLLHGVDAQLLGHDFGAIKETCS